ncbi:MAG: GFA family protein [Candidatus Competibacteraceae bacterium]|nr:GFA family protein [Bdellovibrionales bacterium]MCB1807472.1 GFA family protein [Candidatus Competibacteraceae bacterium]MCB1812759.1 GFA family protein [Candidatus Competibacteraceae bacterium]
MARYQGGCTCGEVRYELLREPMIVHCCHCSWCQRESGSAFAVNGLIEATEVKLLKGKTEIIETPSNSGGGQRITRCSICRIALWSNYSAAKDAVHFVRIGTLDNPQAFPPDIHIFTSTKQPWVNLERERSVVDEYYKRSDYWSEQNIVRYKTALGK